MSPIVFYRTVSAVGLLLGAGGLWGAARLPRGAARVLVRILAAAALLVGLLASIILLGGYAPMPL